jgi:hypothetical protein
VPPIDDDELVLRHIPGGTRWQAPGPRITSLNFELRTDLGETGASSTVSRPADVSQAAAGLLQRVKSGADSRVAVARVGDIRRLGFKVIEKPTEADPAHAEIQSGTASLDDHAARRRLANLFRFLEQPQETTEPPMQVRNQENAP